MNDIEHKTSFDEFIDNVREGFSIAGKFVFEEKSEFIKALTGELGSEVIETSIGLVFKGIGAIVKEIHNVINEKALANIFYGYLKKERKTAELFNTILKEIFEHERSELSNIKFAKEQIKNCEKAMKRIGKSKKANFKSILTIWESIFTHPSEIEYLTESSETFKNLYKKEMEDKENTEHFQSIFFAKIFKNYSEQLFYYYLNKTTDKSERYIILYLKKIYQITERNFSATDTTEINKLLDNTNKLLKYLENSDGTIDYQKIIMSNHPKYNLNRCPECGYDGERLYVDDQNTVHCGACGSSFSIAKYNDPEIYKKLKDKLDEDNRKILDKFSYLELKADELNTLLEEIKEQQINKQYLEAFAHQTIESLNSLNDKADFIIDSIENGLSEISYKAVTKDQFREIMREEIERINFELNERIINKIEKISENTELILSENIEKPYSFDIQSPSNCIYMKPGYFNTIIRGDYFVWPILLDKEAVQTHKKIQFNILDGLELRNSNTNESLQKDKPYSSDDLSDTIYALNVGKEVKKDISFDLKLLDFENPEEIKERARINGIIFLNIDLKELDKTENVELFFEKWKFVDPNDNEFKCEFEQIIEQVHNKLDNDEKIFKELADLKSLEKNAERIDFEALERYIKNLFNDGEIVRNTLFGLSLQFEIMEIEFACSRCHSYYPDSSTWYCPQCGNAMSKEKSIIKKGGK